MVNAAGSDRLVRLRGLAGQETMLDRLWQNNCFTQAVQALRVKRCQTMDPETKSRLALALANCQLQVRLPLLLHSTQSSVHGVLAQG